MLQLLTEIQSYYFVCLQNELKSSKKYLDIFCAVKTIELITQVIV